MKKLLTVTLALFILLTLSGCNKEVANIQPFNEESLALIEKYNGQDFDNSYNIKVKFYDPNTDTTKEYTFYHELLTKPGSRFKKMDVRKFMELISSEEELEQIYILLGEKDDYKTYQVLEQIEETTKDTQKVIFFVDADDIRRDSEVFDWFHERFNYNEIFLSEIGYKQSKISDLLIPTPIAIDWWNQVIIDLQVLGPNIWDTYDDVKRVYMPITEEDLEIYPLGCEQIKYDLGGRI